MKFLQEVAALATIALSVNLALLGCDRKREILDVETPRRSVEIEQDVDTGKVDVEVKRKDVDVDTGKVEVEVNRK